MLLKSLQTSIFLYRSEFRGSNMDMMHEYQAKRIKNSTEQRSVAPNEFSRGRYLYNLSRNNNSYY